jgi:hypothetical protein
MRNDIADETYYGTYGEADRAGALRPKRMTPKAELRAELRQMQEGTRSQWDRVRGRTCAGDSTRGDMDFCS